MAKPRKSKISKAAMTRKVAKEFKPTLAAIEERKVRKAQFRSRMRNDPPFIGNSRAELVPQAELDKFARAMDERVIKPVRTRQLRQQRLVSAARARFVS